MLQDFGWTVARQVPRELLMGILSGSHTLHGGVVRGPGGRIVAHLIAPTASVVGQGLAPLGWVADAFQCLQLHRIGLTLDQVQAQVGTVLRLSQATATLAGLDVVIGIASYVALSQQIKVLGEAVRRIEAQTRRTNQFLDAAHFGELQAALDELRHAREATSPALATECLRNAKSKTLNLVHRAQTLWPEVSSLDDASALEESATVAMTGHALATSELGETAMAHREFAAHRQQWRARARDWIRNHVLRDDPQRLLGTEWRETLPARELVAMLDFAREDEGAPPRGVDWIDELRERQARASRLRLPNFGDETPAVQFARRLLARDAMLAATEAHLGDLSARGVSVRTFESIANKARAAVAVSSAPNTPVWLLDVSSSPLATPPVAA